MPFNQLQRRDSWPPTIVRVHDDFLDESSAIDENPFSFFLTSPDDLDDEFEDLSAGIETSKSSFIPDLLSSGIKRSHTHPTIGEDSLGDMDDDPQFGFELPLSLIDFTAHHRNGRDSRRGHRADSPENSVSGLGLDLPDLLSNRGRPPVRLVPLGQGSGRGQGQTRSLSARKPRSWREPSPGIDSIKEEKESDESDEDANRETFQNLKKNLKIEERAGLSMSAPASPEVSRTAQASPSLKPKKRVHWAI